MARARNIKPGFFSNEDLADCSFETRLLFIGLWTLADRDGRLEDRPKRIKAAVFPYDDVDVDAGLVDLEKRGFIVRYASDSLDCICIANFVKHQNPHHRESPSTLPAPPKLARASAKHGPSMAEPCPNQVASCALVTDSPFSDSPILKPDSGPSPVLGPRLAEANGKHDPSTAEDAARADWELFYEAYPPDSDGRKVGFVQAQMIFCHLPPPERQKAIQAAQAYAQTEKAAKGMIQRMERWLDSGDWRAYLQKSTGPPRRKLVGGVDLNNLDLSEP